MMLTKKKKSSLYTGKVYHKRFSPREHDFLYSSYFLKISLNELNTLKNSFFSIDRFNLFSFYKKDHGLRDGSSLQQFAISKLKESGHATDFDDIVIHTMPRILGQVFNPVSFWYIIKDGVTVSIIAEVNNTFGESHSYVLNPITPEENKLMQVSPFNQIQGHYVFKFQSKASSEKVDIQYIVKGKVVLFATVYGTPSEWTSWNFLKLFLFNPIQNLMVVAFIHFEALRLFLKKVPFYGKNGVVHD